MIYPHQRGSCKAATSTAGSFFPARVAICRSKVEIFYSFYNKILIFLSMKPNHFSQG
jgi:hypothetical protein